MLGGKIAAFRILTREALALGRKLSFKPTRHVTKFPIFRFVKPEMLVLQPVRNGATDLRAWAPVTVSYRLRGFDVLPLHARSIEVEVLAVGIVVQSSIFLGNADERLPTGGVEGVPDFEMGVAAFGGAPSHMLAGGRTRPANSLDVGREILIIFGALRIVLSHETLDGGSALVRVSLVAGGSLLGVEDAAPGLFSLPIPALPVHAGAKAMRCNGGLMIHRRAVEQVFMSPSRGAGFNAGHIVFSFLSRQSGQPARSSALSASAAARRCRLAISVALSVIFWFRE
jgi:hypothetical protein